jgi:light-regulated signal transduction histidine kinase (bacteriophytochrome)
MPGPMGSVQELHSQFAEKAQASEVAAIQPGAFLLELSPDWLVLRASENVHHLLGESHVTLIDEPLGRFVQAQALHDLRNLFSRLSGTTGIARAYGVRLTEERDLFDIAFQLSDGRVILEAIPRLDERFGEAFETVGGLIDGLGDSSRSALLDGGARRMRALTGYDRVTLVCHGQTSVSSRGNFGRPADMTVALPMIVADCSAQAVPVFRRGSGPNIDAVLLRSPGNDLAAKLREEGIAAVLRVPVTIDGEVVGQFRCDSRTSRNPSFELHAAAELFAQLFAMRAEIDRLKAVD